MDKFYINLGAKLRTVREGRGLSQDHVATRLGVTFQMLQKYETGACRIAIDRLIKFCALFNLSLPDLLDLPGGNPVAVEGMRTAAFGRQLLPIITQLTELAAKAAKASCVALACAAGMGLAGCASAPADIQAIHTATLQRITYQPYHKRDWREVALGTTGAGNCAVYAYTNFMAASRAGLPASLHLCHTAKGEAHAYTQVSEWALDNRYRWVIPMAEQDCK